MKLGICAAPTSGRLAYHSRASACSPRPRSRWAIWPRVNAANGSIRDGVRAQPLQVARVAAGGRRHPDPQRTGGRRRTEVPALLGDRGGLVVQRAGFGEAAPTQGERHPSAQQVQAGAATDAARRRPARRPPARSRRRSPGPPAAARRNARACPTERPPGRRCARRARACDRRARAARRCRRRRSGRAAGPAARSTARPGRRAVRPWPAPPRPPRRWPARPHRTARCARPGRGASPSAGCPRRRGPAAPLRTSPAPRRATSPR